MNHTARLESPLRQQDARQHHRWSLSIPRGMERQVNWDEHDDSSFLIQNLRPLAESLSLLEYATNGALTHWRDWLTPAWCITMSSRTEKWQQLSWIQNLVHETPMVEEAYESWQAVKSLSK